MVSAALQDRMVAFEKSNNANQDLTGIDAARSPKVHKSVKHPWSQTKSSRVDASGVVNKQAEPGDLPFGSEETPSVNDAKVHTSVKHPWSERRGSGGRVDAGSKQVSISDDDVESQRSKRRGRPSLKETAIDNISRRRLQIEAQAKTKPVSKKHRSMQILKCAGMSILIAAFIIAATITIVTGWGDGSVEAKYRKQGVVPGRLVALSGNGAVVVAEDDFGFNRVYSLDRNASPMWTPVGPSFRSRGRVELSEEGSTLALIDYTSQRLRFSEYDNVRRNWVQQEAPILSGDDLTINPGFNLLTIGSYGLGSITNFNSKVGEGTITTYNFNDTDWVQHGSPLTKLFGLQSFKVSPDGTGLVTVAKNDGNITLNGYKSFDEGNETYAWAKSDLTITLQSGSIDVAVSNQVYAVASGKSVQVFSYGGRPWGQEIMAAEDGNITSVALSANGRTLAIGTISEDMTGFVEWYRFPHGQDTSDNWVPMGAPLRPDGSETVMFGSALDLNTDASQLVVQSGLEGRENLHFFDVTFRAARIV